MAISESVQTVEKPISTDSLSGAKKGVARKGSINAIARIAGVLYLLIAVLAVVAHVYVPSTLIVPGDAAATASNVVAGESLLRFGAVGAELVILLSELVLSVLLYVLLRPVSRTLALLALVARLAMTIIHGINLLNYFFALLLLSGAGYLAVFQADQLQALALLFLNAHSLGFEIGITFLTLHVFILGYLVFKSGYFPKILGVLLILAGFGYLINSFALLLFPGYETTPAFIAIPIAIGEIAFPLWLVIKGVNTEQWEKRARDSAGMAPLAEGIAA